MFIAAESDFSGGKVERKRYAEARKSRNEREAQKHEPPPEWAAERDHFVTSTNISD